MIQLFLTNAVRKLFFSSILLLIGCQTAPDKMTADARAGHWTAKAQIQNKTNNERNVVDLEMFIRKPDSIRLEVSGSFGVGVASLLSIQNNVQLSVHTQKKFFSGRSSESVLQPVLGVAFDPALLIPILFDESIPQKAWSCVMDEDSRPKECVRLSDEMKVAWSDREGPLKKVQVEGPTFRLQIHVKDFKTKVEDVKVFSLAIPESYKRYKLN
jgi:hypothetical protein